MLPRAALLASGDLYTESGQTLEGSFSAVSRPPIARVGAFFTIFRDLQDFHPFAPLRIQNFNKNLPKNFHIFCRNFANFAKFRSNCAFFQRNFAGISPKFHRICCAPEPRPFCPLGRFNGSASRPTQLQIRAQKSASNFGSALRDRCCAAESVSSQSRKTRCNRTEHGRNRP